MSLVNLSVLQGIFRPGEQGGYDIDGNGELDRPELAKASLNLLGQDSLNAHVAGSLLATFVQGGRDGEGLLPGDGRDNALSLKALEGFAADSLSVSAQNFEAAFGARYQPGGVSLNINGLHTMAAGNLSKYSSNDPHTFTNALGTLGVGLDYLQIIAGAMILLDEVMGDSQQQN